MKFEIDTLGIIRSPYKEKFAIPRQPGLVKSARARLELLPPLRSAGRAARHRAVLPPLAQLRVSPDHGAGLAPDGASAAPRRQRTGRVFATRSTFRPNPLGLSVVELHGSAASAASCGSNSAPWTF